MDFAMSGNRIAWFWQKKPEQIWHTEVGAPASRIVLSVKGIVLTPQVFPTSSLALGPVLGCSGTLSMTA
jgi:hypothetical protein